jgi:hypothetical protein
MGIIDRPKKGSGQRAETTPIEITANFSCSSNFLAIRRSKAQENVTGGYHSWTPEEVLRYEQRHPIGTKARLALGLFLFTGQRKCDVVLLGRQHIRGGVLTFTQQKNRNRSPVKLELPVLVGPAKNYRCEPVRAPDILGH